MALSDPLSSLGCEPVYAAHPPERAAHLIVRLAREVNGPDRGSILIESGEPGPEVPSLVSFGHTLEACVSSIAQRTGAWVRIRPAASVPGKVEVDVIKPGTEAPARRVIDERDVDEQVREHGASWVRARTTDVNCAPGDEVRVGGERQGRIETAWHEVRGRCYRCQVEVRANDEERDETPEQVELRVEGAWVDAGGRRTARRNRGP